MTRFVLLVLLGILAPRSAAAGGVVLESYTQARPESAARLVSPVLDELSRHGFVAGFDGVGRRFEQQVSRPARTADGIPADFHKQVELARRAWVKGQFQVAVATVTPLIAAVRGNPAAIAQSDDLRLDLQNALIVQALGQLRLGDSSAATATMAELIRSFPDTAISRAAHGPEAFDLYAKTKKDLEAAGRGTLIVKTGGGSIIVFVDEKYQNVGDVTKPDLFPGEYRVYVQRGTEEGREYLADVQPGRDTIVDVDWDFDAALHTSPGWTGFVFADAKSRAAHEGEYAARFARLIGAQSAVTVGVDAINGRPAVVGLAFRNNSEVRASITADSDPPVELLRGLGTWLGGGDAVPGLQVYDRSGAAVATKASAEPPPRSELWGGYKWIAGAASLGAIGTGVTWITIDGRCVGFVTMPCASLYHTRPQGYATLGVGAVAAGVSVYLFIREHRHHSASRTPVVDIEPLPGGAFAAVAWTF